MHSFIAVGSDIARHLRCPSATLNPAHDDSRKRIIQERGYSPASRGRRRAHRRGTSRGGDGGNGRDRDRDRGRGRGRGNGTTVTVTVTGVADGTTRARDEDEDGDRRAQHWSSGTT